MKISAATIKILQNFSSIYQGIVIRPGNVLRTCSDDGSVYAEAHVEETFTNTFGVYDLKKLLALLSMSKTPDLTITEHTIQIKGDRNTVSMRHTNTKLVKSPPDKSIVANYIVSANLTAADIKWIYDTSSILGTKHVVFAGKDGKLTVETSDVEGKVVDEGSLEIGETDQTFKAVLLVERLKLMSGDYEVSIASKGIVQFVHKGSKLRYWVALLNEPSKFE